MKKSRLITKVYSTQSRRWPLSGRHVLAQFDEESVVVYQAFNRSIGRFAAEHGHFGGDFSFGRMSWIKTNFLWMMYRSGWGTKPDQEVTLAVWIRRRAFDEILSRAVPSTFAPSCGTEAEWRAALKGSCVRLQWDPDHDPAGKPVERRAIQLGLRGEVLEKYAREWVVGIEDVSEFVAKQREIARSEIKRLQTPCENVYPVGGSTARTLGMDPEETPSATTRLTEWPIENWDDYGEHM